MKVQNNYNESNKRTPPQFPNYYVEQVLETNPDLNSSSFIFTDELNRTIEVSFEPNN